MPFDIQEDTAWASRRKAAFVPKGVERVDATTACSCVTWGPWQVDCFVPLTVIRSNERDEGA